jgi:hypothetical protein
MENGVENTRYLMWFTKARQSYLDLVVPEAGRDWYPRMAEVEQAGYRRVFKYILW